MPPDIVRALREAGYADPAGLGELGGRSDFGGAQIVMRERRARCSAPRTNARTVSRWASRAPPGALAARPA
ncbi:hypothetical protein ACU4GD_37865 [Cupriavidus basilensis]